MVAFASIACLNGNNGGGGVKRSPNEQQPANNHPLGILAFEAAKTVSRLLSLYKSLSDPEILNLRKEILKSKGVVYLNSDDEVYLLKLACAEKIEDLDKAAIVVARLGRRCPPDSPLNSFDTVYADLKLGKTDLRKFEYGTGNTKKKIRKLKRFLSATLGLYGTMHCPHPGLEPPEKKMNSPVPFKNMKFPAIEWRNMQPRIHPVHHVPIKPNLWTLPFEKVVRLMSRIVCIIYARICMVFGPYVPDLPSAYTTPRQKHVTIQLPSEFWLIHEPRTPDNKLSPRSRLLIVEPRSPRSKLAKSKSKKNLAPTLNPPTTTVIPTGGTKTDQVFHDAGPDTVGGSRLQILYANLIMMAEENMVRKTIKDDVRDEMYRMMPENMKAMVKVKTMRRLRDCKGNNGGKQKMKEGLRRIFMWLSPMAHNTLLWARERRVEMTRLDTRPPVLLLQTLHFSDKEKTEAAIVEVLVGLSFMYSTQQSRRIPAA